MKELNKTNRLTILVSAIVLVIVIGLITFKKPEIKYELSPAESLALLSDTSVLITPFQVTELRKDSSGKAVFVDIRNSNAFDKGHAKNAINIPVRELFTKKSRSAFHDLEKAEQKVILYGETQQEASGPWLMLRQTGYKNVLLFTGNYAQLEMKATDTLTKILPQFSESPLIDTIALKAIAAPSDIKKATTMLPKTEKKKLTPVKKATTSGGGC